MHAPLPPNPVFGGRRPAVGKLPPNPVFSAPPTAGSPAPGSSVQPQPRAQLQPGQPDLTNLAHHIATATVFTPEFTAHLKALAAADPTFNDRLNAAVQAQTKQIEAARNGGISGIVGNAVNAAVNPFEVAQAAVHGVGQVAHGNPAGLLDVAGLLPISRGPRAVLEGLKAAHAAEEGARVAEGVGAAKNAYTSGKGIVGGIHDFIRPPHVVAPEEAQAKVLAAARDARAQGHGVIEREPVHVKKGEEPQAQGGEIGRKVREGLSGRSAFEGMGQHEKAGAKLDHPMLGVSAARARQVQDEMYSAERGVRAAKAGQAMEANPSVEGLRMAGHHLEGELPKVDFQGFKHWDGETLNAAVRHVVQSPNLRVYEKKTAGDALVAASMGKVPAAHEEALLERVFGREVTRDIRGMAEWRDSLGRNLAEAVNLPRAIMSSFDLSAPLRQGLVAVLTHPVISGRNFGMMVKSFGSEHIYSEAMHEITSRETYPLMRKAGVPLTDAHSHVLGQREEVFMSRLFGKLPILRGSERAYVGFLNKTRADIFDHLIQQAAEQGHDVGDEGLLKSIGRVIGAATGRGTMPKKIEAWAPFLNSTLFSPRLLASRLNYFSPVFYAKLDPFARREAVKGAVNLVGTITFALTIAKLAGAKVVTDPRNADWGKIKIGDTRFDIAGGFQQPLRLIAQLSTKRIISSTSGKTLHLGQAGPGKLSQGDIALRFILSKASPPVSFGASYLYGRDVIGNKFTWGGQAYQHLSPLFIQDMIDMYHSRGIWGVAGAAVPGSLGVGVQTYKAKPGNSGSSPYSTDNGSGGGYGDSGYGDSGYGSYGDYGSYGGYGG